MLTEYAKTSMKNHLLNSLSYAKYKQGSSYYRVEISKISALPDGRFGVTFLLAPTQQEITITELQLFDGSDNLMLSSQVYVTTRNATAGIFYRFLFSLTDN